MPSKLALTGLLVLLISSCAASSSLGHCQGAGSCPDQVESTAGQVLLQKQTLQEKTEVEDDDDDSSDNEAHVEEDDGEMDDEFYDADIDEELLNQLENEDDEDEDSEGHEDDDDEDDEAEQEEDPEEEESSEEVDEDPLSMRQDDMLVADGPGGKGKRQRGGKAGKGGKATTPASEADAGGSTEKPEKPLKSVRPADIDYTKKVTVGCAAEKAFRTEIEASLDFTNRIGPQLLRTIFHDSVDENNLLLKSKETDKWEPIIGKTGDVYGGVDGCLYSPLSGGSQGVPEPSHNRNLPSFYGWAHQLCNQFCQQGKVKEGLCRSMADCIVDMTVLGSIVTIEAVGGPKIPMTWGRKKGTCKKVIETPFSKDPEAIAKYVNLPALGGAPSLTGIDDAEAFRDSFQKLGFDPVDQVALMGAHTFGKLQVCAGGLNGVEGGPFCNDPSKVDPPLTEKNIVPNCEPKLGVVSHCWYQSADKKRLVPQYATAGKIKGHGTNNGFGDGGFFDRTPTKFDNDYFKLFANETYAGKDVCCGKTKNGGCHRGGQGMPMEKVTRRNEKGLATASVKVGGPCGHNWCRSDRKGRTHMKSVKAWHEAPHDFVKKGYHHGVTKRMVRLAGDWALLGNPETAAAVKKFAESETAFFDAYKIAWGKVISKGYEGLRTCDDADTSVPKVELKKANALKKTEETGKGPFQSDGKGTGCRDTHRRCHTFSPTSKTCKKGRWAKRCPFTCKKCPSL